MKLKQLLVMSIPLLLFSCTSQNEPEQATGILIVENQCGYYAVANVFKIEDGKENEVAEFTIPANGSTSKTLDVGDYRVFARCKTSLYYVSENFTLSKGSVVSVSITK